MTVQLQPFPNNSAPVQEGGASPIAQIWFYLLRALWQRQGGSGATLMAQSVTPSSSPLLYSTDISGTMVVSGGTVSEISIVRGADNVVTGQTAGSIPMLRGDTVAVTFSVAPTVTFLPSEFTQTAT